MLSPAPLRDAPSAAGPGFVEFVLLVALIMSLGAFSIDNLLPAFGPIQNEFAIEHANDMQLILTVYMTAFAAMQLVYGPISDAIGRRPVFMISVAIYLVGTAAALFATNYETLLAARAVQGLGAAAARVVPVAVVRDRFEGREMARVMSLAMTVFIIVPVIAPSIGSLILHVSGWRAIFVAMAALAGGLALWFGLRMPETLHPEYKQPLSLSRIGAGFARTLATRASIGYGVCMGLMMGCVMTYVGTAQQIFETEVYGLGPWFPAAFGAIAAVMGVASFINARLVRRYGMRRLSHGGTLGFIVMAAIQLACAILWDGRPPLLLFGLTLAGCHFLFSLITPNFNAMAMEPLGDIAGTASSLIGFYTTLMGALIGYAVGQALDGTVTPVAVGYLALPTLCLVMILWTERGRLFQPHPSRKGQ